MNSATRFAWTSSSSRKGSELRIVERTSDQGAVPPWSSAVPTIWWAKTSRAKRWTCNGSRSCSRAAWTAVRDGDVLPEHREAGTEELGQGAGVHEDERGAALIERIVDRGEAGRRLRG